MTHAQFGKRLERLERPLQSPKIVAVLLLGEGDEEPPHNPNVEVIQLTLGDPSERAERGRCRSRFILGMKGSARLCNPPAN
jgi:hypothetical protein